jgi:sporulation-control protein spo0M
MTFEQQEAAEVEALKLLAKEKFQVEFTIDSQQRGAKPQPALSPVQRAKVVLAKNPQAERLKALKDLIKKLEASGGLSGTAIPDGYKLVD